MQPAFSFTVVTFATASGVTQPVASSAATSAFPATSCTVLKPWVTLPTLQFAWSSATVAKTPRAPSIQNTQPAGTAPVRPSGVGGGINTSNRETPAGTSGRN